MKIITSKQNKFVKYLIHLQEKSNFRRKENKFVVEGRREIKLALEAGYEFEAIIIQPEIYSLNAAEKLINQYNSKAQLIQVSSEVYARLAYRESTEGIIGLAISKNHSLKSLKLTEKPLILIAESIEKPGNIGAMLRTADAAAIDAFILANPKTDLYNPNIIRASIGAVFTVQIATATTSQVLDFLRTRDIKLYAAALQNSVPYYDQDFTGACAIVVGSEDKGLSNQLRQAAFKNILIPMQGKLDSLNVSVSAAILIFEAKRQRQVKNKL